VPEAALQRTTRVLLIDDDRNLLTSLSRGLSLKGFDVNGCESAGDAVPLLEARWPDVVLLDVSMPGMDGVTFCRLIRARSPVPILMLTARDAIADRVRGLESGADDYLTKPFDLAELVARIHALLRRARADQRHPVLLTFEDLELDRNSWEASRNGRPLDLTATEFQILAALMASPGMVLSRETLLQQVWGDSDAASSNVVDAHVANLRRKVEADGSQRIIQTVRRAGYKLQAA
jgi:two-component system response regulator MprA